MPPKSSLLGLRPSSSILSHLTPRNNSSLLTGPLSRRTFKSTPYRLTQQQQPAPPPPPPQPERPSTSSFKPFHRPFFKVFLGAIFTYQVWYWAWTKLEMDDLKAEKQEELSSLEKKAREMASNSS